ncbi:unnamed protein product [Schistosoma mattheei]|uniref:Uncharacterized protein n=1 Tax=Schistosoma mattheei TaxID=31246 RepID=A0AA85BN79_9TREM|nr:unnamed protein product [Schistosoma mattheei]
MFKKENFNRLKKISFSKAKYFPSIADYLNSYNDCLVARNLRGGCFGILCAVIRRSKNGIFRSVLQS